MHLLPPSSPGGRRVPRASDRFGVKGRFVVASVAPVEVADRDLSELFRRKIERRHGDGVEGAAERFEITSSDAADATGATERERAVRLGPAERCPAVLGHARSIEQAEVLLTLGEGKPGARLCAVRAVAAVGALAEVEVGLEANRAAMTASPIGLYGHLARLLLSGC